MIKIIRHIKQWNIWRKHSLNGRLYKCLVLFKLVKSPTFELTFLPEEFTGFSDALADFEAGSSHRKRR